MSEEALAGAVVTWLQGDDWDVYQEVVRGRGGDRADIVATRGPLLWVIECKVKMGLAVLGQAYNWRRFAHLVSIAVEPAKRDHGRGFAETIMRDYGIGWISASIEYGSPVVKERLPSALRRNIDTSLRESLRAEQRTYAAAGNARGDFYSPFKATCREVRSFAERRPGCTVKELIDGIRHHYASGASARSSVRHWIAAGKVPGVRLDESANPARIYPEPTHKPDTGEGTPG